MNGGGGSAVMVVPFIFCLHGRTRAQILNAEATGPRVPANMGNAEEANHQRLPRNLRVNYLRTLAFLF
jgi:hypothetical protein